MSHKIKYEQLATRSRWKSFLRGMTRLVDPKENIETPIIVNRTDYQALHSDWKTVINENKKESEEK